MVQTFPSELKRMDQW